MISTRWSGGSSSVLSSEFAAWSLARSTWSITNTRRLPWCGRNCARSLSRRVCWIEIWRSGPSGAKVSKSGCEAKISGSSLRFSADHFSRDAMVSLFSASARSSRSISSPCPSSCAPSRRASVALPTPSGPANRSVCASRCWDTICSSACVTCGLPQKGSNILAHNPPDVLLDGVHLLPSVHHFDARRFCIRQGVIGGVDLAVEIERLVVHAGFAVRLRLVARPRPSQARLGIHIHQNRQVRFESPTGDALQRGDGIDSEPTPHALIDQRRVGEAVAEHDFAALQRRLNPLVHILRARREVEQDLRGRTEFLVGRVEKDAADLLRDRRPARLYGLLHRASHAAQPFGQPMHLGGLAGTVHAFKGNEEASSL